MPAIAHSIGTTLPVIPSERPNRTGLPDDLKRGVEALSGIALDDVRVHRNSARPGALGAHAYAQGSHIHVAPGQDHNLPHEAWHIVQQKQGRVRATVQLKGGVPVNDDAALEREADTMGARAASRPLAAAAQTASPPAAAVPGTPVQRLTSDGVVQRQLVAVPDQNHFVDNRDPTQRRFTPHQGNDGLSGTYTCQDNFQYHYDDATKRYRVLSRNNNPAGYNNAEKYWDVVNQREQRRVTMPDHGQDLHRYESGPQRHHYDPATRRFEPLPPRAHWMDVRGQFVDNMRDEQTGLPARRVLTPNGQGVDKQYAVTKEARDYVVPYKRTDLHARSMPGMPGLYGGNVDPHENADQAVAREVREESGNRLAIGANLGQVVQIPGNQEDPNRYTVRAAAVAPQPDNHVQRDEMAGEFRVTASDFVGHTANPDATKARLLARLTQHVAGTQHGQFLANVTPQERARWAAQHTMTALAGQIAVDVGHYEAGRDQARGGQPLGNAPHAEAAHGHGMYAAGAAAARAGNADVDHEEPAYRTGRQDYVDGLAAAQVNGVPMLHAGHMTAMADYQAGVARARAGQDAGVHQAGQIAHGQYRLGHQRALAGLEPEYDNHAYMAGHHDGTQSGREEAPVKRRNINQDDPAN